MEHKLDREIEFLLKLICCCPCWCTDQSN